MASIDLPSNSSTRRTELVGRAGIRGRPRGWALADGRDRRLARGGATGQTIALNVRATLGEGPRRPAAGWNTSSPFVIWTDATGVGVPAAVREPRRQLLVFDRDLEPAHVHRRRSRARQLPAPEEGILLRTVERRVQGQRGREVVLRTIRDQGRETDHREKCKCLGEWPAAQRLLFVDPACRLTVTCEAGMPSVSAALRT